MSTLAEIGFWPIEISLSFNHFGLSVFLIPLIFLLIAVYSISNLALRENMEEFKNCLSQINDIENIKWKKKIFIMRESLQNF